MYWSTIFMIGSLVFSAARISSRTRPSVVSVPGAADFDFQNAGQILRAGKNFVAGLFVRRQRFAGDGGLVERALAAHDDAVRRHVVAGADADDVADGEFVGGDFLFRLVGVIRRALVGVSLMSDSMEARAPSAVRVSMISPMSMKNATTPAVL